MADWWRSSLWRGGTPGISKVIGAFRWQTAPYCNVLTLTVNQQGAIYQLAALLISAAPAPLQ